MYFFVCARRIQSIELPKPMHNIKPQHLMPASEQVEMGITDNRLLALLSKSSDPLF